MSEDRPLKTYVGQGGIGDNYPNVGNVMVIMGEFRSPQVEDPECYDLPKYHDVRNHSPDGFAWGYGGSGPAQLALAILCDLLGDTDLAQRHYQHFKFEHIATIPQESARWEIGSEFIWEWLEARDAV